MRAGIEQDKYKHEEQEDNRIVCFSSLLLNAGWRHYTQNAWRNDIPQTARCGRGPHGNQSSHSWSSTGSNSENRILRSSRMHKVHGLAECPIGLQPLALAHARVDDLPSPLFVDEVCFRHSSFGPLNRLDLDTCNLSPSIPAQSKIH